MKLWTAQLSLAQRHPEWPIIDITVKNKNISGIGGVFAPQWSYVMDHKNSKITDQQYTDLYLRDMTLSQQTHKAEWAQIMNMKEVVISCFCAPNQFCHRHILTQLLIELGAEYMGELTTQTPTPVSYYTGAGSRETPASEWPFITAIAKKMNSLGYWLRTGDARGADRAFQAGAGKRLTVFNPWESTDEVRAIAKKWYVRPNVWKAWENQPRYLHDGKYTKGGISIDLQARNVFQVYGKNVGTPSKVLICWTEDGVEAHANRTSNTGGTGTVISLASDDAIQRFGQVIPVHNLNNPQTRQRYIDWLRR